MNSETVSIQLPTSLFGQLQELAEQNQSNPVEVITQLVNTAYQRRAWLQELAALRQLIQQEGGLQVGLTKEEVIQRLRQTRQEIFEAEYAHLYR
jgi:predicted transcriptional regulator